MTLCPIALAASCSKCPVVGVCPLKEIIGNFVPESKSEQDPTTSQAKDSK
jgi:hypothetical protein